MRFSRVLLGAALALAPIAVQAAPPVPIDQTIAGLEARWTAMIAARDLDGIVRLYDADGILMPANAPLARGTDALRKAWTALLALPGLKATLTPVEVTASKAGDMVIDRGIYAMTVSGATERGKYLVIWKKVGADWKVTHDMFSSDAPGT